LCYDDRASGRLNYFIHTDHIDTPRVVVDRNNNVRWRWLAEPFGTTAPETNPSNLGNLTFNLRFPGQYFDQETNLKLQLPPGLRFKRFFFWSNSR